MNLISVPLLESRDPMLSTHEELLIEDTTNHSDWVKRFIEKPKFTYDLVDMPYLGEPETYQCNNEYNLHTDDKNAYLNNIDKDVIDQFISKAREPYSSEISYSILPISTISSYRPAYKKKILIPPTYNKLFFEYLSVEIEPFTISGSGVQLVDYSGVLFLYDTNIKLPISETVYFIYNDAEIFFSVSKSKKIYFKLPKNNSHIVLATILFNNDTEKLESYKNGFIPKSTSNTKLPSNVPFATSFIPITYTSEQTMFLNTFAVANQSNPMEKIGQPPSVDDSTILLVGKVSIEKLDILDVPLSQDSWKYNYEYPFCALNCHSRVFDMKPVITLSNITFDFTNTTEGLVVGFRVFFCDSQTNLNFPDGNIGFVPKEGGELIKCYESFTVKPDKHVVFPDVVRYYPQNKITPESHFIIQFLIYKSQKVSVYKCAIVEIMKDRVLFTGYKSYPTTPTRNIPTDYLTKYKSTSLSTVTFYIDIPASYILQPQFKELSEALVPMQVKWETIANMPMDILKSQLLPVVAKLLSIISPQTIQFVVNLLTMFDNDKEWNVLFRSWIYHYFDPGMMKHNFLSSFTNSLDQLLQEVMKGDIITMKNIVRNIDIICVILMISYLQKTETWVPQSLITLLNRFTDFTVWIIKIGQENELGNFCGFLSHMVLIFSSLIESKCMLSVINKFISSLLQSSNLEVIYEYLEQFANWNDFILFLSLKIPIRPIGKNWMNPYNQTISLLITLIDRTFTSNNTDLIQLGATFIANLTISLENLDIKNRFRVGYAIFPIFDIISRHYISELDDVSRQTLLTSITFLIGYIPRLQLHSFFISIDRQHRKHFLKFLQSVVQTNNNILRPINSPDNGMFSDLTKRLLMFFAMNIDDFGDCQNEAIDLISSLYLSDYQTPSNYPRIFVAVAQMMLRYQNNKLFLDTLLPLLTKKQHIARCFSCSLILLFYKTDFHTNNNCIESNAKFIDSFATILFNLHVSNIPMYKLMCDRVIEKSSRFNNENFSKEIKNKFSAAISLADLIISLRNSPHDVANRCELIMKIANQYQNQPSMKIKWLKEIVATNLKNNNFAAAFVAQLHICALVSTVVQKLQKSDEKIPKSDTNFTKSDEKLPTLHNLIVCQPITMDYISGDEFPVYARDFEFNESAFSETKLDFDELSEDFKYVSSYFDLELLKQSLNEAIDIGLQAKMFYSLRCIKSLQMRICLFEKDFKKFSEISQNYDIIYKSLSNSCSTTYDIHQVFFVNGDKIFCVDSDQSTNGVIVNQYESESTETERYHCWNIFRTTPSYKNLDFVTNFETKEVSLTQYTVKYALPRYVSYSPIASMKEVKISLKHHCDLETDKICSSLTRISECLERWFPTRNVSELIGDYKPNLERDLRCVSSILEEVHGNSKLSLFSILKILHEKGGNEAAKNMAIKTLREVQRLVKVYHRAIEFLQSEEHFLTYARLSKSRVAFTNFFGLPDIDTKGYEGRKDMMLEKCDFE
ncbi:hypothetical protein TVAG_025700 [Trichomonas vaginalis G3]|uniref:DOCKER Lobe A domain-containing protein n=1 Tax=Trichomonas vaginalis (strain ATCC PRA-98 / G3) TaxID=412133 RepID=A2F0J2_TRIV3|nr:dedicator of cytokinesis DOCK family [Trichomonas vaginalis G3]EAY01572.1 hypothetical protein TVAG_025700 [Trichomonas vaginalis G3]KAI5529813.1 dedicator of cytokinesis DOCK family [Trichomonas vaginalis G3]|eukprot:XP_001314213.1 hypothetical protein [Trichomonas vaginalis G3]